MHDWADAIDEAVDRSEELICTVRRHLHAHPESSGEEFETTAYLAGRLREAGIPHRLAPSGRGIIAETPAAPGARRVVIRGDMDALRIHDQKDVPYRSCRDGVMHACGHDAHAAAVLGAVLALNETAGRLPWPCPWRAVFQPAEETSRGALEMIAAGAAEDAAAVVALHVDPETPVGSVALRAGEMTACCQELEVTVRGRGGHAARPHHAVDPICAAVHFAGGVYQHIPRSVDSREPVVVTFGVIRGGENPNVIPESVTLGGTVRTLSRRSAAEVRAVLERIARGVREVTGAEVEVAVVPGPDAVVNDERVTAAVREAAAGVVGPACVLPIPRPSMGGEDFAAYLHHAPGCLLRLGVAGGGPTGHFLHSPRFDIDERALAVGAKILARAAVLLSRPA
ncbi:MAG TPA: amidohydrolase [Gemmataceae bacterium]